MALRITVNNTTLYVTTLRIKVKLTTLHKMIVSITTLRITVKTLYYTKW
jgi:hypothetical protein